MSFWKKLFKRKGYIYLVSYQAGFNIGDIEIKSTTKLDSYEKLRETRAIIKDLTKHDGGVSLYNVQLLRRDYIE
jgi:hypothetical protein